MGRTAENGYSRYPNGPLANYRCKNMVKRDATSVRGRVATQSLLFWKNWFFDLACYQRVAETQRDYVFSR